MTPLSPEARDLLEFLCAAKASNCRVVRLKTYAMNVRAKHLRDLGWVHPGGFEPTPFIMERWLNRKPPQPKAVDEGAAARLAAPSPEPLESLARHFRPRWERLGVIAKRAGFQSGVQFRRHAFALRDLGLVEMQYQPAQSFWRLSPTPRAPKVDLKVNSGRDWSKPPPGYVSRPESVIKIAKATNNPTRSRIKREAQKRIDEGLGYGAPGSVREAQVALERQQAEAARLADPIEHAKLVIRKRGWSCHDAEVTLGSKGKGKFVVGTKLYTEAQLLELATRWAA